MEAILRKHKLKITDTRLEIICILSEAESAISYNEIQGRTKDKLDKVTVYRNLEAFEKKGIIHSIPSDSGSKLYSMCKEECSDHHHIDNHVHFTCAKCDETKCLYDVQVPEIQLPKSFQLNNSKLIVQGICDQCS